MDPANMRGSRVSALLIAVVGVPAMLVASAQGGVVYKVGGDRGWVLGGTNYAAWAMQHQFKAGDALLFHYIPGTHSVMQVTQQDFKACVTTRPMLTATGGNDLIRISRKGTYYFICGFIGHCAAGMKFEIQASGQALASEEPALSFSHDYITAYPSSTEEH